MLESESSAHKLVLKSVFELHFCCHIPNTFTSKEMFWLINGESEWTWHIQVPLSVVSSCFNITLYFSWVLSCETFGLTMLLLLLNNVILRSGKGWDEFCITVSSGTSFGRKCPSEEIVTVKRKSAASKSSPLLVREGQVSQQREYRDSVPWRWRIPTEMSLQALQYPPPSPPHR